MISKPICLTLFCVSLIVLLSNCSSPRGKAWERQIGAVPVDKKVTPVQMLQEIRLQQDIIPKGTAGRYVTRPMKTKYITIHSTQNPTGNAHNHALALRRGTLRATKRVGGNRTGFLTWHFTTQDDVAIQHLPTDEQGEHADFDGPGNNHSVGIEMCEHRGNNLPRTIDRTAKLAAYLMYEYNLPSSRVVAHYHWPRRGLKIPHKNCPHFLLDRGRPGKTWKWFIKRVEDQHSRIVKGPVPRI